MSGERRQDGAKDWENAGQSRGQCEIGASQARENWDHGSEGRRRQHKDRDSDMFFDLAETCRCHGQRGHDNEICK